MPKSTRRRDIRLVLILAAVLLAGSSGATAHTHALISTLPQATAGRSMAHSTPPPIPEPSVLKASQVTADELVPGTATVTFANNVDPSAAKALINSIGATITDTV